MSLIELRKDAADFSDAYIMKNKGETCSVYAVKLSLAGCYWENNSLLDYLQIADNRVLELETGRDLSRIWLHVDMDAFYAAVETLCDPLLNGKPMAVGGMSMISTANYEV